MHLQHICLIVLLWGLFCLPSTAQSFSVSSSLQTDLDHRQQERLAQTLDTLFTQVEEGSLSDQYLSTKHQGLTHEVLSSLKSTEKVPISKRELINLFPLTSHTYTLDIAFYSKLDQTSTLDKIVRLIVNFEINSIRFSLPLAHLTQSWKVQQVGTVRYFYHDELDLSNARVFERRNNQIPRKLGVISEDLDFYICQNYQEILQLLGIIYDRDKNGRTADGYGVVDQKIFAIQGNEDFSHDIVHYYAYQTYPDHEQRNWLAEEGLAYHWGNAYYADTNGQMISQPQMTKVLVAALQANPDASLWQIFTKNEPLFQQLSPHISTRYFLAGLICAEVEREHGMDGLFALLRCGKSTADYRQFLDKTEELIGLNKVNFDSYMRKLIL